MITDELDALLERATNLMMASRFTDAADLLLPALSAAEHRGDRESASLVAGTLASIKKAQGEDVVALDFHLRAERNAPNDRRLQLNTAHHLLDALERPAEALEHIRVIESSGPPLTAYERHHALALAGRVHLQLGESAAALEWFHELIDSMDSIPADACDLHLVTGLVERSLHRDACERYLARLSRKLHEQPEEYHELRDRIAALRSRLGA